MGGLAVDDDTLAKIYSTMTDLSIRVNTLEQKVAELNGKIEILTNNNNTMVTLIKYVITPLLIIVGALVGIKLTLP
jgi:chorismate-pyruvate lyase